jgi:hypothetical protein
LQGRAFSDDDYCILVVDAFHNFGQIAHVEPLAAPWAFHEVIGVGFGDAVASLLRNHLNCGTVGTLMCGGGIGATLEAFPIPLGSVN